VLRPDELVYGTADQLREMAATLTAGDQTGAQRATRASAARVAAYRQRHPDAELSALVGRPLCEAVTELPAARSGRIVSNAADTSAQRVDVWVDGYITSMAMWDDEVSAAMLRKELDAAAGRDIRVHINSGGGDYFEGVAMAAALADYSGDVYVAIAGYAASAASIVAIAGDRVGICPGSFMMIHEASTFAYGNAADLAAAAAMLEAVSTEGAGLYAAKAGGTVDEWRERMKAETWYGPDAAVEAKLVDERIEPGAQSADPPMPMPDDPEEDPEEDPPMPMPPENAAEAAVVALFERVAARLAPPAPKPPGGPAPPTNQHDEFTRRLMGVKT
jgi:ATP-dependent protease ClpP protease subunit